MTARPTPSAAALAAERPRRGRPPKPKPVVKPTPKPPAPLPPDLEAHADRLLRRMATDGGWWGEPKLLNWAALHGIATDDARLIIAALVIDDLVQHQASPGVLQWRVRGRAC